MVVISVILFFIMLSGLLWLLTRNKNISEEKELSTHTETRPKNLDFMCELPDELIDQILVRLPEESLLRFKSVCHAWNAKINSPSFVKYYGECKYSSMKVMLCTGEGESPIYSFPINCREQEEEAVENIPHHFGPYDYKVVGSCDGLILVHFKTLNRLWIWNPSTRQYLDLPLSDNGRMGKLYFPHYGFGRVNSSGEGNYKVLVIDLSRESQTQTFVMYSTFKKSWRRIEDIPYGVRSDSLALVNAKLHFHGNNSNQEDVLLAFDIEDEEFKELPGPSCDDGHSISELNGKLCIIASHGDHKKTKVWVMKEYGEEDSWTIMFCIDITNMTHLGGSCLSAWPLHFYVDGKILLRASYEIIIGDTEDSDSDSDQSQSEWEKNLLVYYDTRNHTTIIPNQHALPNKFRSKTYVEIPISPIPYHHADDQQLSAFRQF